jgi:hypothetical protein
MVLPAAAVTAVDAVVFAIANPELIRVRMSYPVRAHAFHDAPVAPPQLRERPHVMLGAVVQGAGFAHAHCRSVRGQVGVGVF